MPDTLTLLLFDFGAVVRRYLNRELNKLMTETDLSARDFAIIELLYQTEGHQAKFSEIASELAGSDLPPAAASTVSQAITGLWRRDPRLVDKTPNPDDQRQPIVSLTDAGREVAERIRDLRVRVLRAAQDAMQLREDEYKVFGDVFNRAIPNFKAFVEGGAG